MGLGLLEIVRSVINALQTDLNLGVQEDILFCSGNALNLMPCPHMNPFLGAGRADRGTD